MEVDGRVGQIDVTSTYADSAMNFLRVSSTKLISIAGPRTEYRNWSGEIPLRGSLKAKVCMKMVRAT